MESLLSHYVAECKTSVTSQHLAFRRRFDRRKNPGLDEATSNSKALAELDTIWASLDKALKIVPGKDCIGVVNQRLQERYGVSVTPTGVIEAMMPEEITKEVATLVRSLEKFASVKPGGSSAG